MNVAPSSHPSAMIFRLFDAGRLDEAAAAAVLAHLDACPECNRAVKTRPPGSLLRRLREAQPTGQTIPDMSVEQATSTTDDLPSALPEDVPLDLPSELKDHKQYCVERELGRGGMGVVYLARDTLMNRLVVLKVVNSLLVRDAAMRERFLREIQLAASLRHPNVVTAYHAEQIGHLLILVLEYARGETFEVMMVKRQGRPLPVVYACAYAQQVARGLQHAFEQGLVHRDIKPANLILTVTGKAHLVRILDFGLAKARSDNEASTAGLTATGAMMGTPAYMAPEQSEDAARADIRADIYSLGCTLYFLLAGRPPFEARSLRGLLEAHASQQAVPLSQLRGDVPAELSSVVERMMAKNPRLRYQKPEEVAKALTPFVDAKGLKPLPASPPLPEPDPVKQGVSGGSPIPGARNPAPVAVGVKAGRVIPHTILERPEPDLPPTRPKRPLWVFLVFGVYILLFGGLLLLPLLAVLVNGAELAAVCVCIAISTFLFGISASLLLIPIGKHWELPRLQKSIVVPLVGSATAAALLFFGAGAALWEYFFDAHGPLEKTPLQGVASAALLLGPGAVWIFWIVAFAYLSRSTDRLTLSNRLYQCLIAGSILELLIAIPMHLIVRWRGNCCAGVMTGFGIGVGLVVMLIAIGPGVFFLVFRRYKQVYEPRRLKQRARQMRRSSAETETDEDDS